MNPCSGCSRMVVPYVLVVTEPHSGIAVSARPFSSCGRLSHDGRNIVHCYMCYRCVPFDRKIIRSCSKPPTRWCNLRVLTCLNPTKLGGFDDFVQNWSLTPQKSQFNRVLYGHIMGDVYMDMLSSPTDIDSHVYITHDAP